jgi:tetratricopeptide (TPR) repeat protein
MRFVAGDRLIFALGYLRSKSPPSKRVTQIDLARALILSRSRLQHVLGELRKGGMIDKDRNDPIAGYLLTRPGMVRYGSIFEDISARELIPELHQVAVRCRMSYLMETVRNPLDLVYLVSCYLKRRKVDVIEKLDQLRAINPDSNDSIKLKEMLQDAEEDKEALESIISELTLLGSRTDGNEKPDEYTTNSIDSMLIVADLKRRRGEVQEARWYYSSVLDKRDMLPSSRWIICIVGLIQCTLALEGQKKALEMIDRTYRTIRDPAHIAMLRKVEADIHSDKEDFESAKKLYHSCQSTFRSNDMVLLQISVLNNFGVMLFRQDKFDMAERYWVKARNLAQRNDFIWAKSMIDINLSDPYALKGRIKRAKNMLYESKHYLEERGDGEGVSYANFNLALVSVQEHRPDVALDYFEKAEGFPLIYKSKRDERRRVLLKRFRDQGLDPSRLVFKYPLDE